MHTSFSDNDVMQYLGQPNRAQHEANKEELKACYERIKMLEADLLECREYLEVQADVVDASYGQPAPNRAMSLVSMIDESIHGPWCF